MSMIKVIYFDEGSATDFLQIYYGGSIVVTDEETGKVGYTLNAKANAEVGAKVGFLSVFKTGFSLSGNADSSKSKDSLLKTTISNTILSDFVAFSDDNNLNKGDIEIFKGYKLSVIKDSFTFAKMFTPFVKMFKEGSEYSSELEDFNFLEFDEILKGAKGYYELLGKNVESGEEVIFRFNINTFRNSYSLTDLTKMDLTFYGIEIGQSSKEELIMENEFPQAKGKEVKKEASAEDILNYSNERNEEPTNSTEKEINSNTEPKLLKIYDVILAGISREKSGAQQ